MAIDFLQFSKLPGIYKELPVKQISNQAVFCLLKYNFLTIKE